MSLSGEFMSYHLLLTKRSYVAPTQESASNFLTYVEDLITGYDIAKTKNVSLSLRGDFSINLKNFQKLGIEIINEIIWYKRNSFPNLRGRRFTASHETLLWGHVGVKKREYTFNYENIKKMHCKEDLLKKPGKQMRTVWDIPNNTNLPYFK